MAARSPGRRLVPVAAMVLLIGGAAAGLYQWTVGQWTVGDSAAPPLVGVVRETEIHIASEISTRFESYRVTAGQKVHRGESLAVLSSPELAAAVEEARAALASAKADRDNTFAGVRKEEVDIASQNVRIAEANLTFAHKQYDRAASLASRDAGSRQHLDEGSAAVERAEAGLALMRATYTAAKAGPTQEERASALAEVARAEARLADVEAGFAKATIVAPVDGVVGLLVAEPGEAVSPGKAIMTLEAEDAPWASFTVREDALKGIAVGAPVSLITATGTRIPARVTELRPLGEFATWRAARAVGDHDLHSFFVRADLGPGTHGIEPGMTVSLVGAATHP